MPFHRWFRPGKPDGNLMDRQTFATGDVPARGHSTSLTGRVQAIVHGPASLMIEIPGEVDSGLTFLMIFQYLDTVGSGNPECP